MFIACFMYLVHLIKSVPGSQLNLIFPAYLKYVNIIAGGEEFGWEDIYRPKSSSIATSMTIAKKTYSTFTNSKVHITKSSANKDKILNLLSYQNSEESSFLSNKSLWNSIILIIGMF